MKNFLKKLVPKSLKRLYHLGWAVLSMVVYGRPSKKIKVIGITGTDGKTTATSMLHEIFKKAGIKVAMINGLKFSLPSKEWKNHSDNSTPGRMIIRKFLKQAVEEECEVVILEITSWGIEQHRVLGIAFDVAVITNFSYEHLDLHGTMDRYRAMKGRLFEALQSARKEGQKKVSVINADDKEVEFFNSFNADEIVTYSTLGKADIYALNVLENEKLEFDLHYQGAIKPVRLDLRGVFNVSNALAASAAALSVGVKIDDVVIGLEAIKEVPGRMEFIDQGQPFKLIVDFAHTPNGFRALFEAARAIVGPANRIIAVYGATGDRDPGRRPMVGEIAGELIDFSVLTTEDPHTEDPEEIARQVERGLIKAGRVKEKDYIFVKDRAEAILYACKMAQPGDAVLLCSMGDYDVMYVGDTKIPWSDREVAKEALRALRPNS